VTRITHDCNLLLLRFSRHAIQSLQGAIVIQESEIEKTGSELAHKGPLTPELLAKMDAYWRAANYLSVGQIYLKDNPLLERPLTLEDVKPRLLGHWGTTPGLNFLYMHWNRLIRERDLNMIFVIGPGHGGPGLVANTYLEGSYSEIYPHIEQNKDGIKRLFRQFSWPYGIPSHVAPETPGSIHEGGELGYSLVHAYGAAFDNPNLIVACVVGDGEAETGPLATSWHSNKFLNPATDGAVLPILHLNGYKIANPTILARIPHEELENLMRGYGYEPFTLEGDDPAVMHQQAAAVFDTMLDRIAQIQKAAREEGGPEVVMACCGDVPTLEALAAVCLLRARIPDLRIRVVNVVDLMAWQPVSEHPHGLADEEFDRLFPVGTPIVFAFHGYPWLIHRLTYRHNHDNLHVRGYKEEGTTTTPFDMCVLNNIDRFQLSLDAVRRVPRLGVKPMRPSSGTPRPSSGTSSTWRKTATICQRSAIGAGR
jgi:phosphoketolase